MLSYKAIDFRSIRLLIFTLNSKQTDYYRFMAFDNMMMMEAPMMMEAAAAPVADGAGASPPALQEVRKFFPETWIYDCSDSGFVHFLIPICFASSSLFVYHRYNISTIFILKLVGKPGPISLLKAHFIVSFHSTFFYSLLSRFEECNVCPSSYGRRTSS